MGNMAADNAAGKRINSLLDAGSFVEIGGAVTARTTDLTCRKKKLQQTVLSPDMV